MEISLNLNYWMNSQQIPTVHPLATINVCAKFHSSVHPAVAKIFSLWTKVVDQPTNTQTHWNYLPKICAVGVTKSGRESKESSAQIIIFVFEDLKGVNRFPSKPLIPKQQAEGTAVGRATVLTGGSRLTVPAPCFPSREIWVDVIPHRAAVKPASMPPLLDYYGVQVIKRIPSGQAAFAASHSLIRAHEGQCSLGQFSLFNGSVFTAS